MDIQELKSILESDYGELVTKDIIQGMQEDRYVTLRVNTLKSKIDKVMLELDTKGVWYERVSWYSDALVILNKDEEFLRNLEMYQNGEIYLQSLSSMIPALIMEVQAGDIILDMTAAPGSKTTQMAALANNQAMITAIEKNKIRSERLKYNIEKLEAKKISVLNMDGRKLDETFSFDKILLDAPCSGSGTLEIKDNKIINDFSKELIERSRNIQEELLRKCVRILKPGQILVYSTCSILKKENEDIIEKLQKEFNLEILQIDEDRFKGIAKLPCKIKEALLIKPNKYYEGFFVVKLRKN